ncbi:hypothetical protein KXV85_000292, partial [Aspergillus fumigatus]
MAQFPERMQPLLVRPQQVDRHLHGIAEVNLPQVADMAFGGEGRAVTFLLVGRPDAELQPQLVDGAVHHHVVIGHVEMAVVIDPLRLDLHHGRHERGGRQLQVAGGGCGGHRVSRSAQSASTLQRPEPQALKSAVEALAARFGNRLITSQAVREQHGHTTTWIVNQPPDGV